MLFYFLFVSKLDYDYFVAHFCHLINYSSLHFQILIISRIASDKVEYYYYHCFFSSFAYIQLTFLFFFMLLFNAAELLPLDVHDIHYGISCYPSAKMRLF